MPWPKAGLYPAMNPAVPFQVAALCAGVLAAFAGACLGPGDGGSVRVLVGGLSG